MSCAKDLNPNPDKACRAYMQAGFGGLATVATDTNNKTQRDDAKNIGAM